MIQVKMEMRVLEVLLVQLVHLDSLLQKENGEILVFVASQVHQEPRAREVVLDLLDLPDNQGSRVTMVIRDQKGTLDFLVIGVKQDLQVLRVSVVAQAHQERKESLDVLGPEGKLARLVRLAYKEPQDPLDQLEIRAQRVLLELLGLRAKKESREPEENREQLEEQEMRELPGSKEEKVLGEIVAKMDPRDPQDLVVHQDNREKEVKLVTLENVVRVGQLDHLDQSVNQDHWAKRVRKVQEVVQVQWGPLATLAWQESQGLMACLERKVHQDC